jgi:HAE1 family hydrophobic/amphiphilic exporter-1
VPDGIGRLVHRWSGSWLLRISVVVVFTGASLGGSLALMPPADYLPQGNRNLVFGMVITPPGYSLAQQSALADRIEAVSRPYFEAGKLPRDSAEHRAAVAALPAVPTFDFTTMQPGPSVVPPPLENYFLVSFEGTVFQGGISLDPRRVVDIAPLLQHSTRPELTPGVLSFAFQAPLFLLGGYTGAAVKVDLSGADLQQVSAAASAVYLELVQRYGPMAVQP